MLEAGDTVQLKSGGAHMTVTGSYENVGGAEWVEVSWLAEGGFLQGAEFPRECVTLVENCAED